MNITFGHQTFIKTNFWDDLVNFSDAEAEEINITNPTTSKMGLEASIRVSLLMSQVLTTMNSPPLLLLFKFSITMPAWHHVCIWLDPAGNVTAYLNGQQVADHVPLPLQDAFDMTSIASAAVTKIWTNMEIFRFVHS
jgi:uncharacterized membrane protein